MSRNALNVLVIGFGLHARRSYLPALVELRDKYDVRLAAVVELESQRKSTLDTLADHEPTPTTIFTEPFTPSSELPAELESTLDRVIHQHRISAVIIATEPQVHMAYALWAMHNGLHVLMDKPISARQNAAVVNEQAEGLQRDFELLCTKRDPSKGFVISTQRRYEPGFEYVLEQIEEISRRYGMPISGMQCSHADGQWRLPEEIVSESYHGYNQGYGIVSHGGYHIVDVCSTVMRRASLASGKKFDKIGAFSSFIRPQGVQYQQTAADLKRAFGKDYEQNSGISPSQPKGLGEVDVSSLVTFYADDEPVSNLTINLMHNSFSRRSWVAANPDLYNGNGRVRHEYYNIEQGPYQNIQIHSYHADQENVTSTEEDYALGRNEHFDIYVFRNNGLTGGETLKVVRSSDFKRAGMLNAVEHAKRGIVQEFVEIALGERPPTHTKSDLLTHNLTVQLASLIYRSGIARSEVTAPLSVPF